MTFKNLLHWLRRVDAWLILPAILVVVWGELTHSPLVGEVLPNVWDKSLHFTAYFGLSLMATIAVRANRRALWWALALVLMGGVLEIVQGMTGRDADILDELANTLGVASGLCLGWAGIFFLKALKLVDASPAD